MMGCVIEINGTGLHTGNQHHRGLPVPWGHDEQIADGGRRELAQRLERQLM